MNEAGARKQMQNAFARKDIGECLAEAADDFQKLRRLQCADEHGWVQCITCGKRSQWNIKMDGGHYIGRSRKATLFDPRNVHAQCKGCNNPSWGKGPMGAEYHAWMLKTYGQEVIDELNNLAADGKRYTKDELIELRLEWRASIRALEAKLNN